jgi:hypothetical protein
MAKNKTPHGSKAAFVRANPAVSAPELVKQAQKQGLSLTVGHIYNIRASDKSKRQPGQPGPAAADGARSPASTAQELPRLDAQLRTLILRIGLDRADQIFSELRSSLSRLS